MGSPMKYRPGERVYEVLDGGNMPLRVIGQARHLGRVLTRLDPKPTSTLLGRADARRNPRYITFWPESLARYS